VEKQNLYNVEIIGELGTSSTAVKARNKTEAITKGIGRIRDWREKDRIQEIRVTEDLGNRELTHEDYK
jgi:hypothetical protein